MGLFTPPQKQTKETLENKPIRRAKIVGIRPSYFNPHALTGDTHRNSVFYEVVFEFEDGTRDIFSFHGKQELRPYLQYLDLS